MASSPTRSGTLRPHFLMAVGLGPAQGALSPERRDAPTPRTWPGSRTGSQPHHLSARAAPRGPQAPGSPRPAGSGSRAGDAALQRTGRPSSRPPGSVLPQRTAVGPVGDVGPRLLRILAMKRSPRGHGVEAARGACGSTTPARSWCWWQTRRPPPARASCSASTTFAGGRSLFLPVPLVVDRESTTASASDHGGTEGRPPPRVVSVMRPRVQ